MFIDTMHLYSIYIYIYWTFPFKPMEESFPKTFFYLTQCHVFESTTVPYSIPIPLPPPYPLLLSILVIWWAGCGAQEPFRPYDGSRSEFRPPDIARNRRREKGTQISIFVYIVPTYIHTVFGVQAHKHKNKIVYRVQDMIFYKFVSMTTCQYFLVSYWTI